MTARSRLNEIASRLSQLSREQHYNVYQLFEWPESLAEDRYWIAPELMTCYGTDAWDELSEPQRLRLAHWESVNFFSMNVHLIRELIGEVANRIYTTRYPGLSEFFHDFIHEENEHMWFFATFCQRYGGKIYEPKKLIFGDGPEQDVLRDVIVFGRILIAEELCDVFNARMAKDERLPALVQQINDVHHRDESRHIAFGRQMMRALSEEAADTVGRDEVRKAGDYLGRYITMCLRALYNSRAYADAGLPDPHGLRSRLTADPARKAIHRELMAHTMEFLERIGLCESASVDW
ncbi:diiron oxygenase [Actinocrispum wychmicini]|uniref:Para-aminobenzoate N-oxygenase AurF n=1 Tax=Actinocrispum wychmicini TaxID=1213861 RepID=A0A4V2S806_9PSEU|nr:diiron oxygenase [Actinocrispum wychmicini]TCO61910.1 para-aminobenzoate N-oxygenase AurF [Actinocrispum wychmicini]